MHLGKILQWRGPEPKSGATDDTVEPGGQIERLGSII
jgi:hypothetical protein